MNRKILCLALSGVMAVSAAFFAACRDEADSGNGGNNNGNNSGNNSGTNNGANNGNSQIKPGTQITDEGTRKEIFNALSSASVGGFTYAGTLSYTLTAESASTKKITAEGSVLLNEMSAQADCYLSVEGEEAQQYVLAFLRGGNAYTAMGEQEKGDFATLKTQLKEGDIVLDRQEFGDDVLRSAALIKLAKNIPSVGEGVIVKSESGFELTFDMWEAAEGLLQDASGLAGAIDAKPDMTVSGLLGQKFVSDLFGTLLKGITAKEIQTLASTLLPEEIASALPQAGNGTAFEYLQSCVRSGALYNAVVGEAEQFGEWQTFGEVPLNELLSILSDGELDLANLGLKDMLEELEEGLEKMIVGALFNLAAPLEGEMTGEIGDEDFDLVVGFSFDEDKKLLGFSLEALAEGKRTAAAAQARDGGADGTETPDQGTEGSGGSSPETPDQGTEGGTGTPGQGGGSTPLAGRATLKIEATLQTAPQFFDLAGCKYQGADQVETVPAK